MTTGFSALLALLMVSVAFAMDNGLARRPPMGWSSWNAYGGHQSAAIMKESGDLLVKHGLDKLGYVHVDMDGGWYNFARGHLNASGYPYDPWEKDGGMRGLSEYLHSRGLKLGMYVTGGFLAVYQHEDAWAEVMFNEWGADSVKIDHMCNVNNSDGTGCRQAPGAINHPSQQIVPAFQHATMERWSSAIAKINKTDVVMVHNCGVGCSPAEGLGGRDPRPFGPWCYQTSNTWRSSGDINVVSWHNNLASLIGRGAISRPGAWMYPDSLEVGVPHRGVKLSLAAARAHFSLWCITSSPLYLGMRLPNITADELAIIGNENAIAVNQAWAGYAGDMLNYSAPNVVPPNRTLNNYSRLPANSVWWKPLPNASAAAVMYASRGSAVLSFDLSELSWSGVPALPSTKGCAVFSVWDGKEMPRVDDRVTAKVPAGDVVFVIVHDCSTNISARF